MTDKNDETPETTPETTPVVPEKPVTAADKYADFISSKGGYKSIFQSDTVGMDNDSIAASIGRTSTKDAK